LRREKNIDGQYNQQQQTSNENMKMGATTVGGKLGHVFVVYTK